MKLCIPQLLNAVSLLSPWLIWRKHRKEIGNAFIHRFVAMHLPVSFLYHALQGLRCQIRLTIIAKLLDYVCIHSYAIICSFEGRSSQKLAIASNACCILCIFTCHGSIETLQITCIRMGSLAMSGKCYLSSLPHKHQKLRNEAMCYGLACSTRFILDDQLLSCGHSLFHLLLGGLYGCIFRIRKARNAHNAPTCSINKLALCLTYD